MGCQDGTIPGDGSVTRVGGAAFEYCWWLTSITIPNGVTSIGDDAFRYCWGLTSITIGNGVTSIGDEAFYDCRSLTDIYFEGTMAQWEDISKGYCWNNRTGNYTVHCSDGDIAK